MSTYLVKIRPLDLFSFSTDQKNEYPEDSFLTGKETYFLRSRKMPPQTTVLGMLRYILLDSEGLLKPDFNYSQQERIAMENLIGKASFSFLSDTDEQTFGSIHSLSPLFLINEKGEYLVPNPLNNKSKSRGYDPIIMATTKNMTSFGEIYLPLYGQYDAKDNSTEGYYNLTTREIERNIFASYFLVESRKNYPEGKTPDDEEKEGGLFKREMIAMKKGYSFAVFLDADGFPEKSFGKMGKKKTPYLVTSTKQRNDLEAKVQTAFGDGAVWYYALSDMKPVEPMRPDTFFIADTDYIRNIEMVFEGETHNKKFRKSEQRFNIYKSGCVFYQERPACFTNDSYKRIGMNYLVEIGGVKK